MDFIKSVEKRGEPKDKIFKKMEWSLNKRKDDMQERV